MTYVNEGFEIQINPLMPLGTNSTMFTECCMVAITDSEANCPKCKRPVVGHDAPISERTRIRWKSATRLWKR